MSDRRAPLEIALLWHTFGHSNLGIDALARGHACIIRQAAQAVGITVRFTSLGTGQNYVAHDLPSDVTIGPAPRIKPLLYGKSDFMKVVRRSAIVFDIGEGDSFTDLYGLQRYAFLVGTKLAVLAARRPLIIAPQTIGPFEHPLRRALAASVMRRAHAVYARDGLSAQFLRDTNVTGNTNEFIDVAFALPFSAQPKAATRTRVGLNVSGLLYNGGYSGRNELGLSLDYKSLSHRLIQTLLQKNGVEVHLIAHVAGSGGADDDYPVAAALAKRYPALVLAPRFGTSEIAKSHISGMDYVVAGRMHASIGAFSAGVPVMPIAYSRKVNGLFGSLGYGHYVDGKASSTEEALAKILRGFDRRGDLAEEVAAGLVEANQRLGQYRDRLISILKGLRHE